MSTDESSLEQEGEEQVDVDDGGEEEVIIEEQDQEGEVIIEEQQDPPKIISDRGDGWEYKRENGVYYTKKVGASSLSLIHI